MRIAICGGTFDPFHRGHLDPILSACAPMQWEQVIYVPAFVQPFKQNRRSASPWHRFAMAAMATLGDARLSVSAVELDRGAISYTVDTLETMREEYPDDTIDWVIGDDNLAALLEWRSLERIFELANFAVLTRGGGEVPASLQNRVQDKQDRPSRGAIVFVENGTVPVSSTEIRRKVSAGESIDALVPPVVSRYIDHYGLYRKAQSD